MQRLLILLIVLILALDTAFAEDGINPGVSGMSDKYAAAQIMLSKGKYDEAIAAFEALSGYEDSGKYIFYAKCLKAGTAGDYEIAAACFMTLGDFKDAKLNAIYYDALSLEKKALYEQAGEKYKTIYFFRDSEIRYLALEDKINARDYDTAITMLDGGDTAKAMEMLEPLAVKNYADSNMYLMLAQYKQAEEKEKSGNLKEAYECYASLVKKGYDDPNALRLTWYKDMYAQAEASWKQVIMSVHTACSICCTPRICARNAITDMQSNVWNTVIMRKRIPYLPKSPGTEMFLNIY